MSPMFCSKDVDFKSHCGNHVVCNTSHSGKNRIYSVRSGELTCQVFVSAFFMFTGTWGDDPISYVLQIGSSIR